MELPANACHGCLVGTLTQVEYEREWFGQQVKQIRQECDHCGSYFYGNEECNFNLKQVNSAKEGALNACNSENR